MKAGRSLDEVKNAGLPDKYNDGGPCFIKTNMWIEIVHRSYSKKYWVPAGVRVIAV